jgi:hypothetical protein
VATVRFAASVGKQDVEAPVLVAVRALYISNCIIVLTPACRLLYTLSMSSVVVLSMFVTYRMCGAHKLRVETVGYLPCPACSASVRWTQTSL